jgi:methionine-rich copper-binding protein CopC
MLLNSEDAIMQKLLKSFVVTVLASSLATTAAFAHAFLDHATPAVGATVSGSPSELVLSFTQGVVTAFSSVSVSGDGGSVPASKPVNDPSNQQIIHVRLGHALKPGSYTVTWHVLSVDTHRTEGSYRFTVS